MDWKELERALVEAGERALRTFLGQAEAGCVYAAAFHASYREGCEILSLPALAANTLQWFKASGCDDLGFSSVRWNPADWQWDVDLQGPDNPALEALDAPLQAYANRGSYRQWQAAERRFLVTVARAARTLSLRLADHPSVTRDFVVIFHDFGGDIVMAKRSLTRAQFEANFPVEWATERLLAQLAQLPLTEQAAYYLTRLDQYTGISNEDAQRWLIKHADIAQAELIALLDGQKDAWVGAYILGLAGHAEATTVTALRNAAVAASDESLRHWCISALGYLKDEVWLLQQSDDWAVMGFCANFGSYREKGARPRVLDYAPLERLLAARPALAEAVEQALREAGWWGLATEVDRMEAARGLKLPHAGIRQHAEGVLRMR